LLSDEKRRAFRARGDCVDRRREARAKHGSATLAHAEDERVDDCVSVEVRRPELGVDEELVARERDVLQGDGAGRARRGGKNWLCVVAGEEDLMRARAVGAIDLVALRAEIIEAAREQRGAVGDDVRRVLRRVPDRETAVV
jgi:hypothetical protein